MSKPLLFQVLLFAFSAVWRPENLFSQPVNLGNPPVMSFPKTLYNAGTQVWSMARDQHGVMWFGNNDGMLEFDGIHWRTHPLSNRTIVRSVGVGLESDHRIYAGGQNEFGYFLPEANGTLAWHSLKAQLPEPRQNFADVWNISVREDGVFFRTDNQVFRFYDQKMTTLFPPGNTLHFMGEWQGKLLVQDGNLQLHVFENDQFRPLASPAEFRFGTITGILPFSADTTLVTTIKNGIWFFDGNQFIPWKTQADEFLKTNIIFCAAMLGDGKIAIGTSHSGLITLDRQRRIFQHLNKKSGLQNNTVLSILATKNGSLWLGLDNGIDFVDIQSPFSTFFPDGEQQGTGYTAQIFGGKIYFGTNSGLYAADWKTFYPPDEQPRFSMVRHSEGQVWSLNEIGGSLLMGHHEGAFAVNGLTAEKLTNLQGVWKFVQLSPEFAVAGHYNGLAIFKKTASGWAFESTLAGLTESSRLLGKDTQGNIWMAHPYRGIFRIRVNPLQRELTAEFFSSKNGLPSDLGNYLFQLGENVVFTGETGIFSFDFGQNRFTPEANFEQIFGSKTSLLFLKQDAQGNIWYVTDRETGMLLVENNALEKKIRRVPIPELSNKLTAGFQFVLPVDRQNVFVATDQGFIHFNPTAWFSQKDTMLQLVLHEVRLKNAPDSILFGGHLPEPGKQEGTIRLSAGQNSLIFAFSAPDYPGSKFVRYSHFLEGTDRDWSDWTAETDLFFNNLAPGDYIFHVKARTQHGIESEVRQFRFKILPPWYASRWAYLLYILSLAGLVANIIYRQQRRFASEKKGLVHLHQQHTRDSEAAINRLKNEKLEAEVEHKNQELASSTLHLLQKSEILNTIKSALEKLKDRSSATDSELKTEILRIIKMLEHDAMTDANWELFSQRFDQVHSDFLKRIGEQHAQLSPNDFKLCAYLRLNLSSKEIATLLNISLRGVESSRYRLRKRLGLDTEANLTEYLLRF